MAKNKIKQPGFWAKYRAVTLWKRVLVGLALGAVVGLALRWSLGAETATWLGDNVFRQLGNIFVRLIRMLIVPLVFTTLVAGIIGMGDPKKLGSIGLKAILLYLATTMFAVTIGIVMGSLFRPGEQVDFSNVLPSPVDSDAPSLWDRFLNIIPDNPFGALATGDVLAIIFFAILFGIAVLVMGKTAKPVGDFIVSGAEVILKITGWVMEIAPFGVFFLIAWVTATQGLATFTSVALVAAALYLGCLLQIIVVYGGLIGLVNRLPLIRYLRGSFDAMAVAYSTSSSSATMPVTISCAKHNLGVSNSVAASVLPLGATINMDGTSLYLGILAMFAAQAFGLDLSAVDYVMIAVTATAASVATAGVPSASLFLLGTVLPAIGVSPEQTALMVGFILPFDRPLDMMRTLTNVSGDLAVATTVAKSEGELDEAVFRTPAVV
jgi:Na+/H+-dicarboxylate symporter